MQGSELNAAKSGELTLKQGGIMMLGIAILLGAVQWISHQGLLEERATTWNVGGIPVHFIAALFALAGMFFTIVGFVRKA